MKTLLGAALALSFLATPVLAADDKEAYCKSMSELDDSIKSLKDVSKTAPMSELRARLQSVSQDLDNVIREGERISQSSKMKMQSARLDLSKAIRAVPDDVTVDQGKRMVEPQIKNLQKAREDHEKSLDCD